MSQKMIVKEIQYDYLEKNIIHVDLMRVDVSQMVKISVPIVIKGIPKGTHEGGIIEVHTDRMVIVCRVSEIPEDIVVSVKDVGIARLKLSDG